MEQRVYISHLLSDNEMREVIAQTNAGVECIDFSISENLDSLNANIESYRERLKSIGTKRLIIHGPFLDLNPMSFDSEIVRVTKLRFDQAYEAARELGADKIVYHTCFNPTVYFLTGWAERTAEFYREFLEDKHDVETVIENLYDEQWEPIKEVITRVDNEKLRVCFDIGHAHCNSSLTEHEWVENLKEFITHVHLHDNFGEKDSHLCLGEGTAAWENLLKSFSDSEDVTYTIECNTKSDVLKSYERIQKYF